MTIIVVLLCLVLALRTLSRSSGAPRSPARELSQRRLRGGPEG